MFEHCKKYKVIFTTNPNAYIDLFIAAMCSRAIVVSVEEDELYVCPENLEQERFLHTWIKEYEIHCMRVDEHDPYGGGPVPLAFSER